MNRRDFALGMPLAALGPAVPLAARAQAPDFAARPIRIIVPYSPGGDADVFCRKVGDKFRDEFGQIALVENRPGGSGLIAWQALASSAADGHTLLLINYTQAVAPAISRNFAPEWYRQVTPLVRTHSNAGVIVTGPKSPFKTLDQLIAYGKANPGKINGGVVGKSVDLPYFAKQAGIEVNLVPYKGVSDVNLALLNNEVQLAGNSVGYAKPLIEAGRMVALAVGSPQRNPALPDVPSASDKAPGYSSGYWFGFVGPGGMAAPVAERLGQGLLKIIRTPDLQQYFREQYSTVIGTGPKETAAFIEAETRRMMAIAREVNVTAD